ncbi:dynein light chain 2, cytoplasmic isoform 1-T4 [Amazona ochrocephala]
MGLESWNLQSWMHAPTSTLASAAPVWVPHCTEPIGKGFLTPARVAGGSNSQHVAVISGPVFLAPHGASWDPAQRQRRQPPLLHPSRAWAGRDRADSSARRGGGRRTSSSSQVIITLSKSAVLTQPCLSPSPDAAFQSTYRLRSSCAAQSSGWAEMAESALKSSLHNINTLEGVSLLLVLL